MTDRANRIGSFCLGIFTGFAFAVFLIIWKGFPCPVQRGSDSTAAEPAETQLHLNYDREIDSWSYADAGTDEQHLTMRVWNVPNVAVFYVQ